MQAFPQSSFSVHSVTVCNCCRRQNLRISMGIEPPAPVLLFAICQACSLLSGGAYTHMMATPGSEEAKFYRSGCLRFPLHDKTFRLSTKHSQKDYVLLPRFQLTLWELWGLFGRSGRIKELTTSKTPFHCYIYLDMN